MTTAFTRTPPKIALTYQEREALHVLRKAICTKPHIIKLLMENQAEALANVVLQQVSKELNQLLEVNRAFSAAAQALIKEKRSEPTSTRQDDEGPSEHAPQGLLLRPAGPLPEDG